MHSVNIMTNHPNLNIGPTTKAENSGYTLLFAVLTAALVLGVAVFIVSVSTKQFELTSAVRNSMYSFYAADSGIECVALVSYNGQLATTSNISIPCNNQTPTAAFASYASGSSDVPPALLNSTYALYKATINIGMGGGTCASIFIYDGYNTSGAPYTAGTHYTIVDSRGYNHCVAATHVPDIGVPNTVERALRMSKQG